MTNKNPLTKDKILKLLKKDIKLKLGSELIGLEKSLNRFLAKDLVSKLYLPPFNNSAVDGYALLKSNLNNSNILINNKRIVAGDKQNIYLKKNTVSRWGIFRLSKKLDKINYLVKDVVEKPSINNAPSNKAVIGRYILPKKIFSKLSKSK